MSDLTTVEHMGTLQAEHTATDLRAVLHQTPVETPITLPSANVIRAATAPMTSCRPPLNRALRPVNSESTAPTVNNATPLSAMLATTSSADAPKKNGRTGISAP